MRLSITAHGVLCLLLTPLISLDSGIAHGSPLHQGDLELIPAPREHAPRSPVDIEIGVPYPTQGANFGAYFRKLVVSITRELISRLPESTVNGKQGTAVVRIQIQKDGSLSKDGAIIESTSGMKDMDAAAQSGVRSAAPFGRLPEAYDGPDLILLLRISFVNVPHVPARRA